MDLIFKACGTSLAIFEYEIINNIIVIYDLHDDNNCSMTVTNDIEAVINEISKQLNGINQRVIYRDTQGIWDEVIVVNNQFHTFSCIKATALKDALIFNPKNYFEGMGYFQVRQLSDGAWVGLINLMFTTGLCMGLARVGWEKRYCFENAATAWAESLKLKSINDIPEGWVAKRPENGR